MIMKKTIVTLVLFLVGAGTVFAQKVKMYTTTATERWTEEKCQVKKSDVPKGDVLHIYADSLLQKVTGFGGTFNEIGWMRF